MVEENQCYFALHILFREFMLGRAKEHLKRVKEHLKPAKEHLKLTNIQKQILTCLNDLLWI